MIEPEGSTQDVWILAAEIHARLEAHGNPERRTVAASYTPTAMEVLGVSVPHIRSVVRDINRSLKESDPKLTLALTYELIEGRRTLEGRQTAYEILSRNKPALASLKTRDVERLGRGMDNWVSVDVFGGLVAGPAWRNGQVTDQAVARWAESADRWWRRAALVSTVALNQKSKGGPGDTPRTLAVYETLVADADEMVVKGLSWALRELAERDPDAVSGFLERHDNVIAARVRREVRNKLSTGSKNPRKR